MTAQALYASEAFENTYTYPGNDLGAVYTPEKTAFRVWAPTAQAMTVNLYTNGDPAVQPEPVAQVAMTKDLRGTWVATLPGDRSGIYYTYLADHGDRTAEACEPYARATGVNGHRAMILDLAATDPDGWGQDRDPHYGNSITDAVIYELHLRDLSADSNSGIRNAGKYLGLTETGTKTPDGIPTGLDHIKNLGITHIHLLPIYDFGSVDESKLHLPQYNWGYDPVNYNVPEGSYATDPYDGAVRVRELKQMVKTLHDNGISVIMDVVYNHVYERDDFCFNRLVPGYFSRPDSNGSACGNDTASERSMVRKYIVDSVTYWAEEYHIDGFRFDLVGLIDTDTINAVIASVHAKCPNVLFYGEGWQMDTKVTKPCAMTTQRNAHLTPKFAFFSDTMRDMLKGSVFDEGTGFVSGAQGQESLLRQCFRGLPDWCPSPAQTINYASCHDNHTLMDRITLSTSGVSREDRVKMNLLSAAICLLSQGVPFFQAGEEMLRSKPMPGGGFDHNSYHSPDSVNAIKWSGLGKEEFVTAYRYYRGLIAFRKANSCLRLTSKEEVIAAVSDIPVPDANVVGFQVKELLIVFNANDREVSVPLPEGNWDVYIEGDCAGIEVLRTVSGAVTAAPISALVLKKQ